VLHSFRCVGLGTAAAQAQTRAYVLNPCSNTVSVIDTATNTVVATIPVGFAPFGVAITPDGTRAYVADFASDTVSVIDTATNMVVTTVPVGGCPLRMAITPAPQGPTSIKQCKHGRDMDQELIPVFSE
jgi:YVTN family beta-propeller protein